MDEATHHFSRPKPRAGSGHIAREGVAIGTVDRPEPLRAAGIALADLAVPDAATGDHHD